MQNSIGCVFMGVGCKPNMIRRVLPSLHSPFTTHSSHLCYSPCIRSKELDFGTAKLSLMAFSFDENEMLHGDSLRPHACSSSCPQTLENDYSSMETLRGNRSHKGLHNTINDAQPSEKDISIFICGLQVCNGSHFHLLMKNVKVLENRIADSDSVRKDILLQLGKLGELGLFHACLSRSLEDPTISTVYNSLAAFIEDCQVKEGTSDDLAQNMVCSNKKHERKARNGRRLQMAGKSLPRYSDNSIERFSQPLSSAAANKKKVIDKRVMLAKNQAEMSRGIRAVAKLERLKARLEKETGKAVSLRSWAEAAGIDEKVLQHQLHFGWYCRGELLKSGRSLVLYLARNYRGPGVAHEDLIQAGNMGMLQGAERFDDTTGYQLSTYVKYWVRKAMSQLVSRYARGIKVPPTLNSAVNRVQRARKDLKATLGKHPDDVELAKFTGLSLDKIKSTEKCLRMAGSIEQKVGRDTDVKFFECTPDTSIDIPEKIISREHMRNDLNKLLKDLDPKQRQVLLLRCGFEGRCMSLQEIGNVFDVTKQCIRKREKKAFIQLKVEENQKNFRHYLEQ